MKAKVLPTGFRFSQSILADYARCKRLFLLRHVKRLDWPAPVTTETDAWETALQRGQLFHHLVRQDALGLDVSPTVEGSDDPLLREWWCNYSSRPPEGIPEGRTFTEIKISVPLVDWRLVVKFDQLVLADDGRIVIVDWKTGQKRPDQAELEESWQTLVYRYVAVEGITHLNGGVAIAPAKVILIYWHASYPDLLNPIGYSRSEHESSRSRLESIVREIAAREEVEFVRTEDRKLCLQCEYRSFCGRGHTAGDEWEIRKEDLDLALVPEAEY